MGPHTEVHNHNQNTNILSFTTNLPNSWNSELVAIETSSTYTDRGSRRITTKCRNLMSVLSNSNYTYWASNLLTSRSTKNSRVLGFFFF